MFLLTITLGAAGRCALVSALALLVVAGCAAEAFRSQRNDGGGLPPAGSGGTGGGFGSGGSGGGGFAGTDAGATGTGGGGGSVTGTAGAGGSDASATGTGGSDGSGGGGSGGTGGTTPPPDAGSGGAGGTGGQRDASATDTTMGEVGGPEAAPEVGPPLLFDPAKLYLIQPVNNGGSLSVEIENNSQMNGSRVQQWNTIANRTQQQLYILANANATWRIVMKDNQSKCFETLMMPMTTPVRIADCSANNVWQQWTIAPDVAPSTFQLKLSGNNLYLDQPASSPNPGVQLQVYMQNNTPAQKWVIKPVP